MKYRKYIIDVLHTGYFQVTMSIIEENLVDPATLKVFLEKDLFDECPRGTDKRYLKILLIALIIWMGSCYYVISNGLNNELPLNITNTTNISVRSTQQNFTGRKWFLDVLTYDVVAARNLVDFVLKIYFYLLGLKRIPSTIDVHPLVNIWLLVGWSYLTFWVSKGIRHRSDDGYLSFQAHKIVMGLGFLTLSVLYHIGLYSVIDLIPDDECYSKFIIWFTPQVIFLLYILSKILFLMCDEDLSLSNLISDLVKVYKDLLCFIIFSIFTVLTMICIAIFTKWIVHNLAWSSFHLYIIIVGSLYFASFIHKFGEAVVIAACCVESTEIGSVKGFFQALFLILRYHLGSVAYIATILLPWIATKRTESHARSMLMCTCGKMKIQMEYERNEAPMVELMHNYKRNNHLPPSTVSKGESDEDSCDKVERKTAKRLHYVSKNILLFTILYNLKCKSSIKIIVHRYLKKLDLPYGGVIGEAGFAQLFAIFFAMNEASIIPLRWFERETGVSYFNVPDFTLTCLAVHCKIILIMWLMLQMTMCCCELIISFRYLQAKDKCHGEIGLRSINADERFPHLIRDKNMTIRSNSYI